MLRGDLDGDGRDDLVIAHFRDLGLYLQGDLGLGTEVLFPSGETTSLAAGDVNGDGCKDLVVGNYYSSVDVYYGQGCVSPLPPPAPVPDLSVALAGNSSVVIVGLANSPGTESIESPLVQLDLSVRIGTLQTGALPTNCVIQSQTARSQRIECLVDALAPGSAASLTIPVTGAGPIGFLMATVQARTNTNEKTLANNRASDIFMQQAAAASLIQVQKVQAAIRISNSVRQSPVRSRPMH